jgi:hypothetical protein
VEARYPDIFRSDLRSAITTSRKSGKTEKQVLEFRFCTQKNISVSIADHTYDLELRDGGGGSRRAGWPASQKAIDKTAAGFARWGVTKHGAGMRLAGTRKAKTAALCRAIVIIIIIIFVSQLYCRGPWVFFGPESPTL